MLERLDKAIHTFPFSSSLTRLAGLLTGAGRRAARSSRQTAAHDFQRAMLESLQEGIVACDADGTLTLFNRAARDFHGLPEQPLPPEEWAGHFDLYQADGLTPMPTAEIPLFRALQGEVVRDAEMVIAPKDGPARMILASGQAIYSHDRAGGPGRKIGAVAAMHDVSARRQAERELARLAAIVESSEDAILASTLDGTLVSWNAGAERLYGYAASEVIGRHASVLALPGQPSPIETVMARLRRGEAVEPVEVVRRHKAGKLKDVSLSFSPIRGGGGEVVGVSCIARDITARRQAEEALRRSEATLRAVLEGAPVVLWAASADGVLTLSEGRGLEQLGLAPGEAVGLSIFDFDGSAAAQGHQRRALAGETVAYDSQVGGLHFHNELRPLLAGDGGVTGLIGVAFDVTERRRAEEALRESEARLSSLADAAFEGIAVSQDGVVVDANRAFCRLFGYDALEQVVGKTPHELAAQESRGLVVRNHFAGHEALYEAQCLRGDGSTFHAEIRGRQALWGGRPARVTAVRDVTERVVSEERFRVLFEMSSDAHVLSDEGGIIDCNRAAVAMLRCADKAHLLRLHPASFSPELQPDGQRSDRRCWAMEAAAREKGVHRFEWVHRRMDGEEFPVEVTLTPVTLNGRAALLAVWHDLTERNRAAQEVRDYAVVLEFQKSQLEAANRELEALATTDGLTGLKNHRTFQQKLAEEHARSVRYRLPLSLLLLDVDSFKSYNDAFGHPAGDEVLRRVAAVLTRTVRDTDVVARYGGEEFALILPQTDAAGALVIAERLRAAVEAESWERRPITVSAGTCALSLNTPAPADMVTCADKALYRSKKAGRNRVTRGRPAAPAAPPAENVAGG